MTANMDIFFISEIKKILNGIVEQLDMSLYRLYSTN